MSEQMKNELAERVIKFMKENKVSCEETIYQCDWVIENAYEFVGDLFNIVKSELDITDEGDF
jgi:hypothetical protein